MKRFIGFTMAGLLAVLGGGGLTPAEALYNVQCPCTAPYVTNADGNIACDAGGASNPAGLIVCRSIAAGEGYTTMANDAEVYIFGFKDNSSVVFTPAGIDTTGIGNAARLGAEFPGTEIRVQEGQQLYLTLHTTPFAIRPDLFDPHTIHFHGFPNASAIFDGEPMASLAPNPGASFTYYYNVIEPGTYMYHCHVEATEHMQMGMLAKLYVRPAQDSAPTGGQTATCQAGGAAPCLGFVYNDGDGTTGYQGSKALMMLSFDPLFHVANTGAQPLNFAYMEDTYPMMNGRGYPDTVNTAALPASPSTFDDINVAGKVSQIENALVTINKTGGVNRFLLRVNSLATVDFFTIFSPSIPMQVVGQDAKIMRTGGLPTAAGSESLYYTTNSFNLGGGESVDLILDVTDIPVGTYFLYSSNLNHLNNNEQTFGGMMTEVVVQ